MSKQDESLNGASSASRLLRLQSWYARWKLCQECPISLALSPLKSAVGEGDPDAKVLFIGEAPGAVETIHGLPFVGPAGQCLRRHLIERLEKPWFLANLLCCRPSRSPKEEEVENCRSHLLELLDIIHPKWIILLGNLPKMAVAPYLEVRGIWYFGAHNLLRPYRRKVGRIWTYWSYHPSFVIRNGGFRTECAEDEPYTPIKEAHSQWDRIVQRINRTTIR